MGPPSWCRASTFESTNLQKDDENTWSVFCHQPATAELASVTPNTLSHALHVSSSNWPRSYRRYAESKLWKRSPRRPNQAHALVGGERLGSTEADPVDPCEVGVCRDQSVELRGELPELLLREAVERAFSKLETQNNWEIEITKAIGDPKTKARGR